MASRKAELKKVEAEHKKAMEAARTSPAEVAPRHVRTAEVRRMVHGPGPYGRFNNILAVFITKRVGTMTAAYLFALLALISLPAGIASHDTIIIVAWVAQTFLQLVLLPIIIVGQNVISEAQDVRAETDHETLTALHTMNVRQLQLLEQQETILDLLKTRATA